ncbi:hypothetical protein RRG08_005570 [Elysia crispata]|uniref:Uncharacterized protein n=1 Tax=Elysia crispata TaxID=231223 RepID=A0AAE1ACV4_9GAST|nr:hypothetical protein RRG08_005570 [Elysia crispata]
MKDLQVCDLMKRRPFDTGLCGQLEADRGWPTSDIVPIWTPERPEPKFSSAGMVGEWKNTSALAQNAMFDLFMARQGEKGLLLRGSGGIARDVVHGRTERERSYSTSSGGIYETLLWPDRERKDTLYEFRWDL